MLLSTKHVFNKGRITDYSFEGTLTLRRLRGKVFRGLDLQVFLKGRGLTRIGQSVFQISETVVPGLDWSLKGCGFIG